MLINRVCRSLD